MSNSAGSVSETRRVVVYLPTRLSAELERIARGEGSTLGAVARRLIATNREVDGWNAPARSPSS